MPEKKSYAVNLRGNINPTKEFRKNKKVLYLVPSKKPTNIKEGHLIGGFRIPASELNESYQQSRLFKEILPWRVDKSTILKCFGLKSNEINKLPKYLQSTVTGMKGKMFRSKLESVLNASDAAEFIHRKQRLDAKEKILPINRHRYTKNVTAENLVNILDEPGKAKRRVVLRRTRDGAIVVSTIGAATVASLYALHHFGVIDFQPVLEPIKSLGHLMFDRFTEAASSGGGTDTAPWDEALEAAKEVGTSDPGTDVGIAEETADAATSGGDKGFSFKDIITSVPERMRNGEFPFKGLGWLFGSVGADQVSRIKKYRASTANQDYVNAVTTFIDATHNDGLQKMLKKKNSLTKKKDVIKTLQKHIDHAYDKGELMAYIEDVPLDKLPKAQRKSLESNAFTGKGLGRLSKKKYVRMVTMLFQPQEFGGKGAAMSTPKKK